MLSTVCNQLRRVPLRSRSLVAMYSNDGAVREAGGAFSSREKAQEDQYFRKQQQEQLAKLKTHMHSEIEAHEKEIKRHQEAIERLKKNSKDLEGH